MQVRLAQAPRGQQRRSLMGHSVTRPLRQKATPVPTRKLVRTPADLAVRVRPDATQASDCAQPAGRSAPHTVAPARSGSQAEPRAAHASRADSTTAIVQKAAHY